MTTMNLDFEAARQRADERLSQELTRIRNLPKRSKITICNKHGLQHAHHMNTGLLKSLEVDLSIIKREKRRVLNELNKTTKQFTDTTQRSFPGLLPAIPGQEGSKAEIVKHHSPQRFQASWNHSTFSDYFTQQQSIRRQQKRDILLAITEQSKKRTKRIIEQNVQKMHENALPKAASIDNDGLLTRLNKRASLRKSCFPSLLASLDDGRFRTKKHKPDSFYKGTTYFMPVNSHDT